jgi:hypothetical protein
MGRLLKPAGAAALAMAAVLALLCGAAPVQADELDLSLDLRAVSSDASPARAGGGLGTLRYDADHQGLRLGYLRVGYRGDPTPSLRVTVEGVAYGDHDVNTFDLTEAYAEWRALPAGAWRSRVKLGAFYPEISLENRMRGWRSPYTLSFSAINTWVGEELRTIGGEYSLDWLGHAQGHDFEWSSSVAAYGWNDPAGTVLATRGWGLGDRQGTLFGRFAHRGQPLRERTVFYDELDRRAGYYASTTLRYRGLLELRALHYDNRARLGVEAPRIRDATWLTRFEAIGARWTPTQQLTVIAQWLHGRTFEDAAPTNNDWSYGSEFLLASWQQSAWRWSLRYDRYEMAQTRSTFEFLPFLLAQRGHAWTLATDRALGEHWHVTLEGIESDSNNVLRSFLGVAPQLRERQLQLAVRWEK